MNDTLPILLEYAASKDWAMEYDVLQQMVNIVDRHCRGMKLTDAAIEVATSARADRSNRSFVIDTATGQAVIPVSGVIAKYSRMVNGSSQPRGTSIETLTEQLREAVADKAVRSILLHVESPGGSVEGLADFANEVYNAGFEKPVTAFIDDMGASAAYWIASQANRVYANQTAAVGSIGVFTILVDSSKRAEQEGLKFHIIRSGDNKGVGAAGVEITEDNRSTIQGRVDAIHRIFTAGILRSRPITADVIERIADGRLFTGAEAVENKLIDGLRTIDEALAADPPELRISTNVTAGASADSIQGSQIKENVMTEKTQQPDAAELKAATDAAVEKERTRISAINSSLTGDGLADVREKAVADGMSVTQAKASAFDAAQKLRSEEVAGLKAEIEEGNKKLEAIASSGDETLTSTEQVETDETASAGDEGTAECYTAAVEKFEADGKTQAEAYAAATKKYPKSQQAWLDAKRDQQS